MSSSPASGAYAVTPNDSTNLPTAARALYIGGAGNVALLPSRDTPAASPVVFVGVPAGTILPCSAVRVKATDTTATNIVALL